MKTGYHDFRPDIRALKIIHLAMAIGQILFAAMVLFLLYTGMLIKTATGLDGIFLVVVPFFVTGGFIASHILFRTRISMVKNESGLDLKLAGYRGALVIRYALLEGPCLLALVVCIVTTNLIFMGFAALIILYFLTLVPSATRIASELELNPDEKSKLEIRE